MAALAIMLCPILAASNVVVSAHEESPVRIDIPLQALAAGETRAWFAPRTDVAPATLPVPGNLMLAPSVPVHLSLPAIGVESDLMELGLTSSGALEVPPTAYPAGWYSGAPTPGELGPAVLAGHVDWASDIGVFHDLHKLATGDEIVITRADASVAVFVVTSVEQYAKNDFPTHTVYGDIDHAGLRLITCGGDFDWDVLSHRDNIVVFATLDRVMYGR